MEIERPTFYGENPIKVVLSLKAPPGWGEIEIFPTSARYLRLARLGAWFLNRARIRVPWNLVGPPESTQYGILRVVIHDPDMGEPDDYTASLFILLVLGFAMAAGVLVALAVMLAR